MRRVTYLYEDTTHPDRATGHIESPDWTDDDRSLLLALARYEATLCPGCGEPKHLAWHSSMEGFYEPVSWVCHACTAAKGHEVGFYASEIDKDLPQARIDAFPPFRIGLTTTDPTPHSDD